LAPQFFWPLPKFWAGYTTVRSDHCLQFCAGDRFVFTGWAVGKALTIWNLVLKRMSGTCDFMKVPEQ